MILQRYDTLESTQLFARRELEAGRAPAQPTAFVALQQTGGIGRRGRPWWSPRGGAWMTVVCPLDHPLASAVALVIAAHVAAACEDAAASAGCPGAIHALVKWPNDVMLNDRKLAGVLIESILSRASRYLLVGVGINANLSITHLPQDIADRAISLQNAIDRPIDLDHLIRATAESVETAIASFAACPPVALQAVRARLWGVDRPVPITLSRRGAGATLGVIRGISETGELLAEIDGVVSRISSAEVGAGDDARLVSAEPP